MDRAAIDRLYAVPLAEFIAKRDALARAAREEGNSTLAVEIKALAKPAVPAWALNQLARRDRRRFERWLAAVAELHGAQVGMLSGTVETTAMREAQRAEREAMVELREAAAGALGAHGHNASIATLERVVRTFRGAAMDVEAREKLTAGRLSAEHDEPGFDALVPGAPSGGRKAASAAPGKAPPTRRLHVVPMRPTEDRRAAASRNERVAGLRARLRDAREKHSTARAEAGRAANVAERTRRAADEAVARAREADAEAKEAAVALASWR